LVYSNRAGGFVLLGCFYQGQAWHRGPTLFDLAGEFQDFFGWQIMAQQHQGWPRFSNLCKRQQSTIHDPQVVDLGQRGDHALQSVPYVARLIDQ
jgi:hypothetical protein